MLQPKKRCDGSLKLSEPPSGSEYLKSLAQRNKFCPIADTVTVLAPIKWHANCGTL